MLQPNGNEEPGVLGYTRRPHNTPGKGVNNNRPYLTGKNLADTPQSHRAGIKEAMAVKCSGTFVTVCTCR